MALRLLPALLAALLLLPACGDSSPTDAGADASADMGRADAGPDLGAPDLGPPPPTLYGPCNADSDCPGDGAVCRRNVDGWPGGYCTVPCTDRTPCDDGFSYNHCLADGTGHSFCERRCENGIDCSRNGYTCEGTYPPAGGRCIAVCTSDADCGTGAMCQHETGKCVATGTAPPSGADVGGPCATNTECSSGLCTPEMVGTAITGNVHGNCFANCILPPGYNPSTTFSGADLPQGSCQANQVCIPAGSATAMGDLGVCLHACRLNSDCRMSEGYACARDFGSAHFGVGFCRPADCMTTPCPTGYTCTATSGGNLCARM